ncbi:MAG TPA: NADP-dependent oxidoreductase [Acidimicrobiales bacterium]|nr:NADP-dependent oxidoreductase [Acidimicrobiales bacterium]
MTAVTGRNRRLVLAQRPSGMVDNSTVRLEEVAAPEPGPDEAVVRVRYLSIDPTIRTWMNDAPGYLPAIAIGDVVRGGGIGEVVASRSDRYTEGDLVFGMTGWQDYALIDEGAGAMQVIPAGIDPLVALSVFGVTGMTAYFGLLDVGRLVEGDTVVVSGAAGATGSVVGQIARIKGAARVVGIAGTEEKCAWLTDELGFDAAVNYRTDNVGARLRELCPKGIDVYFDNVGGEILDLCLGQLALRGRVVLCGAISTYNEEGPVKGPGNYRNLIVVRARMEGFLILDYLDRFPEAQAAMFGWVADGRMKHSEHVVEGLENATDALNLLFTGGNTGKVIVKVDQ